MLPGGHLDKRSPVCHSQGLRGGGCFFFLFMWVLQMLEIKQHSEAETIRNASVGVKDSGWLASVHVAVRCRFYASSQALKLWQLLAGNAPKCYGVCLAGGAVWVSSTYSWIWLALRFRRAWRIVVQGTSTIRMKPRTCPAPRTSYMLQSSREFFPKVWHQPGLHVSARRAHHHFELAGLALGGRSLTRPFQLCEAPRGCVSDGAGTVYVRRLGGLAAKEQLCRVLRAAKSVRCRVCW